MNRQTISDYTGFDHGDPYTSPEQVRDYFNNPVNRPIIHEVFDHLYDPEKFPTDRELATMAEAVIENRWHCDFNADDPIIQMKISVLRDYIYVLDRLQEKIQNAIAGKS